MFTGIIEEIGQVENILYIAESAEIFIKAKLVLEDSKVGDSISVNGVCLTITQFSDSGFAADVLAETMRRSNLNLLKRSDKVNLERALAANSRFGGHIVAGHIDSTGKIIETKKESNGIWIKIESDSSFLRYIVEKGSVAIDGISLTVVAVTDTWFSVCIIPHTSQETTLNIKGVNDIVNLEADIVGKYVEKFMGYRTNNESTLTLEFLQKNGFA